MREVEVSSAEAVARAGVMIAACTVNAAAVCTSAGAGTWSKGMLQARMAAIKVRGRKLTFHREFISQL
jgi:hypothetical protein